MDEITEIQARRGPHADSHPKLGESTLETTSSDYGRTRPATNSLDKVMVTCQGPVGKAGHMEVKP